jgi:hypothetical protein
MDAAAIVRELPQPLTGSARDSDGLISLIGDARYETQAVEPLERTSTWDAGELPETYPFNV